MKTRVVLLITLILIFLSGCIETKVYLGREDPGDEQEQVYGAVNPTTIPAGITWGTFRAYINENFEEVDLAIDTLDNGLADAVDSISAHRTAIQLRLLRSDSTIFASQHDLATGLAGKQDTFTLKTVNGSSLIGSGDITIEGGGGAWGSITGTLADQEDLSDALASKQDTSFRLSAIASLADGSGQLTNDGSGNYSWAATGGTGTVTSVGITVPTGFTVTNSPITTNGNLSLGFTSGYSLPMTADQVNWSTAYDWVNSNGLLSISGSHSLLFRTTGATDITLPVSGTIPNQQDVYDAIDNALASALSSAEPALAQSDTVDKIVTKTFLETRLSEFTPSGDIATLETRVDSIVDVLADTANLETVLQVDLDTDTLATKAYARSVGGDGGGVVGITLNSGTITLNGSEGTADDITFYTNGDGSYDLPAGGGNLTIMSQVQGWIKDSLDNAKVDIRKFDSDTIPLFVFGLGSGHSTDTALFNNGRLAGAFYNSGSDTLYVTELRGVLVEGTGTETIDVQVSWHTNMKDVSAINLNTTALTINNMTTGTSDTSFNNNGIPPGRWVWCVLSGASSGNKPTALMLTMTGYRRNRSY